MEEWDENGNGSCVLKIMNVPKSQEFEYHREELRTSRNKLIDDISTRHSSINHYEVQPTVIE